MTGPRPLFVCLKRMGQFVFAVITRAQATQQFRLSSSQLQRLREYEEVYHLGINLRSCISNWFWAGKRKKFVRLTLTRVQYTHLSFGIPSNPAIWQRFNGIVSARLDGTCVIMDDLLVGGSSDEEHLRNLEAVFVQRKKLACKLSYQSACLRHVPRHISSCAFQKYGLQPTDE